MTEWTVVGVMAVLAGLIAAIMKPLLTLNTSITKLTTAVGVLQKNLDELTTENSHSHTRLWEHNERQDGQLSDHETRIQLIESDRKG